MIDILETFRLTEYYQKAEKLYGIGRRPYHNFTHAVEVVNNCFVLGAVSPELILAGLYHDAIYIVGCKNNEELSSLTLQNDANQLRYWNKIDPTIVSKARTMIESTTISDHLGVFCEANDPLAFLLDADLRNLSLNYSGFECKQHAILEENFLDEGYKHKKKSADFLSQFLTCRPTIYRTPYAIKNWEDRARENITEFCRVYS
jgi:predicted metal-dependent HD superfamily phosphohydrolase